MMSKIDIINVNETKSNFIQVTTFWMAWIVFITTTLRIYVTGFELRRLLVTYTVAIIFFLISQSTKKNGYKKSYVYMVLLGFVAIVVNGAYNNGSFQAPVVAAILIIPIFSSLLLEDEGLKIGILLNLFLICIFTLFSYFNLSKPFNGTNSNLFFPIIYFASTLITYLILRVYLSIKNKSDSMIVKMYNEIILKAQVSSLINLSEGMSHEINNPLTIISIKNQKALDIIKNKPVLSPEDRALILHNLEKVQDSTKRITKIISALFNFAHNVEPDELKIYSLSEILNFSVEAVLFRASAKNIQFKIASTDLSINVQKGPLVQVIVNLLNNSIDAIESNQESSGALASTGLQNKWIEINVNSINNKYITISIIDSGKGIPIEFKDKIFLPFFTTKDVGRGSGMGLSLSLGIMQSMGGELLLDSKSSHTKFDLIIPRS